MSLAEEFAQTLADQPPDWTDLFFELRLPDESMLDDARLSMAPAQLERIAGERTRFSFRVSSGQGYGVYAPLAQACLAKLDASGIQGELSLERVLSGIRRNLTQGPV